MVVEPPEPQARRNDYRSDEWPGQAPSAVSDPDLLDMRAREMEPSVAKRPAGR